MNTLIQTIQETRAAIDSVPEDKRGMLVDSLIQLTRRLVDNVIALHAIPDNYNNALCPAITAQLEAAEKRTEHAADRILSATEAIMNTLPALQGGIKDEIQKQVNAIFEASNFQDLVSQHLNEIRLRLNDLNEDMRELQSVMASLSSGNGGATRRQKERRPDAHLLNGPTTAV